MVGPVCAKLALIFSGCITAEKVKEANSAEREQMAPDILTGDTVPQEKEINPNEEVCMVEHLQELEMGVENQDT